MQVKTTKRYYSAAIKMTEIKHAYDTRDAETSELSYMAGGNAKLYNQFAKSFGIFLES